MTRAEVEAEISKVAWYHAIDLPDGEGGVIRTPGIVQPNANLIGLPPSLAGASVLDICALDGGYSYLAASLGASDVLAVDSLCWGDKPLHERPGYSDLGTGLRGTFGTKAAFDVAHRLLGSRVRSEWCAPEDVGRCGYGPTGICHIPERFDHVLLLGVLYHMKDYWSVMRGAWRVTEKVLYIESHTEDPPSLPHDNRCVMTFYPGSELNDDATNWWGPSLGCLLAMCANLDPKPARVERQFYTPIVYRPGDEGKGYGRAVVKVWR